VDDAELVEVVHGGEDVFHPHACHGQHHGGLLLEQAVDVDEPARSMMRTVPRERGGKTARLEAKFWLRRK
jgi:hypothetical protein